MNEAQFELISFKDGSREGDQRAKQSSVSSKESDEAAKPTRPRAKQNSVSSAESDESSKRSAYLEMEDREMARAIKRIEKLSAEIRANEDVEGHARLLRERIDVARKSAAVNVAQLNEKMDAIEQAWDDRIIQEQKEIAKEVLSILKDLKEDDLSKALSWKKKGKRRSGDSSSRSKRSGTSSRRSTSGSRSRTRESHSATSLDSKTDSSSMSKKIARLDKKEREFAGRAVEVKKDARQIDEMSRNLDTINELERVVNKKLTRMQSVGDARPGSAVYGTVELVDNYRNTVEHLAKAIRSLSSVACLPAITMEDPLTKAEIDKICGAMREFMGRIKEQLGSNGHSAEGTPSHPQTSVRVAGSPLVLPPVVARPQSSESVDSAESVEVPPRRSSSSRSSSSVAASTAQSIESHRG